MTHFPKFYGCPNVLVFEVSSFLETLKDFFSEEYIYTNKIQVAFLQMKRNVEEWVGLDEKKLEGVTT